MRCRKFPSAINGFQFYAAPHIRVLAQRLVPRICSLCTQTLSLPSIRCSETIVKANSAGNSTDSLEVLRRWGCSEVEISRLIQRQPRFLKPSTNLLENQLGLLSGLGFSPSDLVRIVQICPHALHRRTIENMEELAKFLLDLFGSGELLRKAILRNPPLMLYRPSAKTEALIERFKVYGVSRKDFASLVLSRPSMLCRASLTDEKFEYIRKTGVPRESKSYKHIVGIFSFSRLESIRQKAANIAKFGLDEQEVYEVFGRSPFLMTLSVDKVQRNMTFLVGVMKIHVQEFLYRPTLLQASLEKVLRPRYLVAQKLLEMGLAVEINGPSMFTAMRMQERRFMDVYITCHPVEITNELMDYYNNVKSIKRLAESSKTSALRGFPF